MPWETFALNLQKAKTERVACQWNCRAGILVSVSKGAHTGGASKRFVKSTPQSRMNYLQPIDYQTPEFGELYDELPLWSAHFGLSMLQHVEMRPGMSILDVGAGTGFLSIELAQRCGPDSRVIAVDPWTHATARLRRKIQQLGLTNIEVRDQDITAVDLPDNSIDLIVSNLGINNFDNPLAALNTCFRLAKPGASLFLTTNLQGHLAEFYDAYRDTLIELGHHSCLEHLDRHIQHRATIPSVTSQLEAAGFIVYRAYESTFHERFVDGTALLNHHFIRLAFMQDWRSVAPAGQEQATFTALERRLKSVAQAQGELSLTVPAACIHARKPGSLMEISS